jgi:eukaryotic-like serine/threonine-protein kinase
MPKSKPQHSPRESGRRLKTGARIGTDLTVLGVVDGRGTRPVYIVWHDKLACPLACKALHSPERAQQEAGVLDRLAHPYIVRSFGIHGSRYLLTEFLEGPTLSRLLRTRPRGRLPISDAVRVAIHLAAALNHIHQCGYFYLDMKPSNVIVTRGHPILFDFGTARRRTAARPKWVHGTDPYIAPEECRCQPITEAADTFGLGVTVYELITGELPFSEGTKKVPFPQTAEAPSPMQRHRPGVPVELDALILSCLGREPQARPTLARLIPEIHKFIKSGPRMWPLGFNPQ